MVCCNCVTTKFYVKPDFLHKTVTNSVSREQNLCTATVFVTPDEAA